MNLVDEKMFRGFIPLIVITLPGPLDLSLKDDLTMLRAQLKDAAS